MSNGTTYNSLTLNRESNSKQTITHTVYNINKNNKIYLKYL